MPSSRSSTDQLCDGSKMSCENGGVEEDDSLPALIAAAVGRENDVDVFLAKGEPASER